MSTTWKLKVYLPSGGPNYMARVDHPTNFKRAGTTVNVSGNDTIYDLPYEESPGEPAGQDIWTLPIPFNPISSRDVDVNAKVGTVTKATQRPTVHDGHE